MPDDAALPMPPAFLREELDEEHEASYFAESDKILSFAFKSIVSPEYIVSLNGDFGKIWAGIGERERAYPMWISSLIFCFIYNYFALNLLVTHYFISIDSPLYQILRLKRDDWTKWTDEASGAYIQYSSIAEEGSVSLIKSTFANAPSLCKLWNKSHIANRTSFHLFSWCVKLTSSRARFSSKLFIFLLL